MTPWLRQRAHLGVRNMRRSFKLKPFEDDIVDEGEDDFVLVLISSDEYEELEFRDGGEGKSMSLYYIFKNA